MTLISCKEGQIFFFNVLTKNLTTSNLKMMQTQIWEAAANLFGYYISVFDKEF